MEDLEPPSLFSLQPVSHALQFLAAYGWWLLGATCAALYVASVARPALERWRQQREDAAYHKDPDVALQRMEAVQRARDRQQELLAAESARRAELQREREEKKRSEVLQRATGGAGGSGARLGSGADYLPLSGTGGAGSSYRAPKKSKCGGGGCGR